MLSNILGVVIVKQDEVDKFLQIISRYTSLEAMLEDELSIQLKVEVNRFVAQLTPALKAFLEVKSASYADKKVQKRIKKLMRIATASLEQVIELIELENAITLGLGEYVEYARLEEKLAAPLKAKDFDQVRQIWDEFFATQSKEWKKRVAKELEGITERFNNNAKDRVRAIYIDTVRAIEEKLKLGELSGQTVAQSAQAILDDVTRDPSTDKFIPKIYKSALNRAEAIAYTEIHRARVATILDIAEADGKKYFTWVTMGDGRVCDRCRALHGKTRLRTRWTEVPPLHPRGRCVLIPGRGAKSVQGFIPLKPIIRTAERFEGKLPDNYLDPTNKEFKTANRLWVKISTYKAKIETTSGDEKKKYINLRRAANKLLIDEIKRLEAKGLRWVRPS